MVLIYVAIALFVLIILWLALQPKQGTTAANAPDDDHEEPIDQLPKPQEELPSPKPPEPVKTSPPKVEYELPEPGAMSPNMSELQDQVRALLQNNQKIDAIKLVRSTTGLGLKESKEYVETLPKLGPIPAHHSGTEAKQSVTDDELDDQIWSLMQNHKKIDAIKLVRAIKGWDLKEAKDYVERFPSLTPPKARHNSSIAGELQIGVESFDIDHHDVNDRLRILLQEGRKINGIKLVLKVMDWGLKEAKEYVDNYPEVSPLPVTKSGPVSREIRQLLSKKQYMAAVHVVQERTGMDLEEARGYLEQVFDCNFPF